MNTMLLDSLLTCPHCGYAKRESMPTDACLFFYQCKNCKGGIACQTRRLLRVLLVWVGAVPNGSGATATHQPQLTKLRTLSLATKPSSSRRSSRSS